jgi:uncharacterized protein YlxP (DUF503 family)
MFVGVCTIVLRLAGNDSLKGKRSVIKSVMARLRGEFNVAVAEVDTQDDWQRATLGMVTVSADQSYAHGLLERAVRWIEETRPDVILVDYQIEWY